MSSPHLNSAGLWKIVCSICQTDSEDIAECDICEKLACVECIAENIDVTSLTGIKLYKRVICVACTKMDRCHLCDSYDNESVTCKGCDLSSCRNCYIGYKEMCTQCAMLEQSGAIFKCLQPQFYHSWRHLEEAIQLCAEALPKAEQ